MNESPRGHRQLMGALIRGRAGASDAWLISQAVLILWAYSAASGAIALTVAKLVASVTSEIAPTWWVRLGTLGVGIVAAGLNGPRVLRLLGPLGSAHALNRHGESGESVF